MQIEGNVFVVTGGASGLGRAAAHLLLQRGGAVVIADLDEQAGQRTASELGAHFIRADVSSEEDAAAVFDAAVGFGRLRGLVNCAGLAPAMRTISRDGAHPLDLFAKTLRVNLIGTFNMIRLAAQVMAESEPTADAERGVIVNTASVAAFDGQVGQAAYAASKGGVVGMTLPLARDLARNGIRVVTIAPGIFETPMVLGMPKAVQDALGQSVPFPPRLGRPTEYASLVEQILVNPMLNGEVIRLDGAIRMQPK